MNGINKSVMHRIVCVLLCFTLVVGTVFLVSCNEVEQSPSVSESPTNESSTEPSNEPSPTPEPPTEELTNVVVFKENAPRGTKLSENNLEIIELPLTNIPKNIVTSIDDVNGLYTDRDFYKGDYVIKNRLSADFSTLKQDITKTNNDYVIVTDFIESDTGADLYENIQRLIDENPGRTLYFPDGEYQISHSLVTTSDPANTTSFYFSSGAVLKAHADWQNDGDLCALICLGAKQKVNDINTPGSNFFIIGGTFIANGKGDGLAIFYGRETLIKNVVILNTRYGIHIVHPTNSSSSDSDIDDVTIIGNGKRSSIGVNAEGGLDNTFTNIRISNVKTGMYLSAAGFAANCTVENTAQLKDGVAYECISGDAWFSDCMSLDYITAFKLIKYDGYLKNCVAAWNNTIGGRRVAFYAKEFRCKLIGCKAVFPDDNVPNYFLRIDEDDGDGTIVSPIYDKTLVASDDSTYMYLTPNSKVVSASAAAKEN